ncbi:unnamed protein product [Paramecium octaurelia]|uniref:Uncharacterized protein n=1 Tax=Paramecium octaurelia TaxID=43137 RepID=A0A8S1XWA6_PAROT|nr:unnamed protein product [Paramecium octaurelia]
MNFQERNRQQIFQIYEQRQLNRSSKRKKNKKDLDQDTTEIPIKKKVKTEQNATIKALLVIFSPLMMTLVAAVIFQMESEQN